MNIVIKTSVESLTGFADADYLHVTGYGEEIPVQVEQNGSAKSAFITMTIPEGFTHLLLDKEQLQHLIDGINRLEKILSEGE